MKKKIIYTFLLIVLSFISFNIVKAEEYVGEITPRTKRTVDITLGKVKLESFDIIRYVKSGTNIGTKIVFTSKLISDYSHDTNITFVLKIYDRNQVLIHEYSDELTLKAEDSTTYNKDISPDSGIDVDSIDFYSFELYVPIEADIFDQADKGDYFYKNFVTTINVNENNVYDVKQSFTAVFNEAARAINMYVPYRHIYYDKNNRDVNKRAVITNLETSDFYTENIEKGKKVITIGDSDPSIVEKDFDFSYSYNVGKDKLKGNDEFVFYIIKDVSVDIDGLSFVVTMPKEFDKDYISFVDEVGNKLDNVEYEVEGNVIKGSFKDLVRADSEYAIKVVLPDKYFVNTTLNISPITWLSFIVPIVFMISTIIICFVSKRTKNKKKEQAGLYLTEDIDSLELGYILKNGLKETDISTLVFYLANKKYVSINMSKGNYTITKLRDFEGHKTLEGILMKRLFANGDTITRKDLRENLKNVKEEIDKSLKYKKKKRFYILPLFNYKLIFWLMIFINYYLIILDLLFEYQPNYVLINVLVGFVGIIIMLGCDTSKNYQLIEKILCTMVGIVLILSPMILTAYEAFVQDILYVAAYIIGIVCIVSIGITSSLMNNRTALGNYMYRKIVAYKSYLINAPVEEVAAEVSNNKNYFYETLPYVLVMGMSDKFFEKFENIEMEPPEWYQTNKFKLDEFYEEMKNIYSDFYLAIKNK